MGYENLQKELIQVLSDGMLIAIPKYVISPIKLVFQGLTRLSLDIFNPDLKSRPLVEGNVPHFDGPFLKVCARLSSGVRYGIGFVLERACGPECLFCLGSAFDRKCRYFSFRPHYEVKLELKPTRPKHPKVTQCDAAVDSFNDLLIYFRTLMTRTTLSAQILSTFPFHWPVLPTKKSLCSPVAYTSARKCLRIFGPGVPFSTAL